MKKVIMPIIIILLIIIVVGIVLLGYNLLSTTNNVNPDEIEKVLAKPIVELSQEIDQNTPEKATINLKSYTEDGTPIKEIILPDETKIDDGQSEATYEVIKNGTYEFTVVAENGETVVESIEVTDIKEISANNPYIPEGFEILGGTAEAGLVIADSYGNQYVWVPVPSGKLTRNTSLDKTYEETSTAATDLVNSVGKYYGFYIARFESSEYELDGKIVSATMPGKKAWVDINCQDAINVSKASADSFGYNDCRTALISSFAWDTTIEWIDKNVPNYSSNTNYGNYSGTVYPTGYTEADNINNICDLSGNVREWTTEIYKDAATESSNKKRNNKERENIIYRVVRGGSADLNRTPAAHNGYDEMISDAYWGFRMVLYK